MPIYEYQCSACGQKLEKLQKFSDPLLVDCPACAKPALRKMVTAAGFRLKGSGWYETDFKTDGKRNLAGDQESGSKVSANAGTNDKPASKPADKSTDKPADSGKGKPAVAAETGSKSKHKADPQPAT